MLLAVADITLQENSPDNVVSTQEVFGGKKVVLFGVPGAFTPGCSKIHLPGYVADFEKFKEKGVDELVCITVNDAFVCAAWKDAHQAEGKVRVLADSAAIFTKSLGLEVDLTTALGNVRSKRYSAYVVDGEIKNLNVEPDGTGLTCSLSPGLLPQL
jgi:2-Cys peroxiredoxin 5